METTSTPKPSWTASEIAWIKAHERLLIFAVSAFLLFRAGQGIENIILKHDSKAATQSAVVVNQDAVSNKALTDQLAQMKASVDSQTSQINASIATSKAALLAQQKKDALSTPSEINARWQGLLPLRPGSIIQLTPDTTFITNDAANQTVQALEQIPVLQSNITYLTQEINAQGNEISKQSDLIAGLNKQIVDETEKDKVDSSLAKAQGRKSFLRGLKIGFIAGAVSIEAIRILAGKP